MQNNTFTCILLVALTALVCTQSCPSGFISREKNRRSTCCRPKICNINEGHELCSGTVEDPGEDQCFPCPNGTYNLDRIDTAALPVFFPVCRLPDCKCNHEGGIIMNPNDCKFGRTKKVCQCNRSAGYYGSDPISCLKVDESTMSSMKQPGYELTDEGQVRRCKPGFYKSSADTSICKAQKICLVISIPGSPTNDTICDVSMATLPPDVPDSYESTTSPRSNSTELQDIVPSSTPVDILVIAGVGGGVVLMIIVILCIYCCIRCSRNGGNIRSQDEREQIHPLNPSGIYDEIGVERRMGGELSYSILSQDSVDTTNGAHCNTPLKTFVTIDPNPEQEDAQKFCPGAHVVTELDIVRFSDQKSS
ncbi:uncharacterized protein LOC125651868 isoform X2 [Ostrea edulis]|uniref:uncharacterized protein LOC125651868 isoform X2 n=1 Tax=Ostrea edulis TaxID=37623 RepID=UPI0024AFA75B|nr:uncharacterized protein LOC125651868 isoform X2 [Ostrea edulis]